MQEHDYAVACATLLAEIDQEIRATAYSTGVVSLSDAVRTAMRNVPREQFVPYELRAMAYGNYPLRIGHGQTISQPYIVALMTELLRVDANSRVLEVGTGSGYQAAVLAQLVARVYSLEILEELSAQAVVRFTSLGYRNIEARLGDGHQGWPEQAPFDGIIVTAAAPTVPPALISQLRLGGRLVMPVGDTMLGAQKLVVIDKDAQGRLQRRAVLPVAFVPLTGGREPLSRLGSDG